MRRSGAMVVYQFRSVISAQTGTSPARARNPARTACATFGAGSPISTTPPEGTPAVRTTGLSSTASTASPASSRTASPDRYGSPVTMWNHAPFASVDTWTNRGGVSRSAHGLATSARFSTTPPLGSSTRVVRVWLAAASRRQEVSAAAASKFPNGNDWPIR
ncbi:hypothetical protein GCM10018963_64980 [Saccharothrix longispora]